MGMFITRHYHFFLTGLVAILMVLCFLIGREEGRTHIVPAVVLSCAPETLSELKIPVHALSGGVATGQIHQTAGIVPTEPAVLSAQTSRGKYFGSKNGTKYYTPGCAAGNRIKPENYVWFSDEEDARLQGYTPARC